MNRQELTKSLFALLVALLAPGMAIAYDFEVNGIYYNLNKYTQTLEVASNYQKKYSGHMTIPESCTINGKTYPVTKIGNNAFYNSDLTSIILPNSIDTIDYHAFMGCKLSTIDIPNSVKVIRQDAFNGCKMVSVTIPNSVEEVGRDAFKMETLKTAVVGTGIHRIDWAWGMNGASNRETRPDVKVFWLANTPPTGYQDALGKVNYVANELYNAGYFSNAQYEWHNQYPIITVYPFLSSMFTVDGIVYVPINPSERTCDAIDCTYDNSITTVNIGPTVTYKGISLKVKGVHAYTCFGNENIKHARIGEDIASIGDRAFHGCTGLEEFNIPNTVNIIGSEVFQNCKKLKNVVFEDGNDELKVGYFVFQDCGLDSVYIGRNLSYKPYYKMNYYGPYAHSPFYRNTTLRSVHITDVEDEIYDNEFYGCSGLKNVRIGDGVKTIGNWAFSGCSSLDYFAFGSGLKSIGEEAFSDCTAVTQVISHAATPPSCYNQALDDINKWTCVLTVPRKSVDAYQAAPQWKEFFFIEAGVKDIQADTKVKGYRDLQGRSLVKPVKGLNIVEQENGTAKKVIIR